MKRISNLPRLRESLCREYEKLVEDDTRIDHANAVSRMAGVIVASCKIELDYAELTGNIGPIDFLIGSNRLRAIQPEPHRPGLREMVLKAFEQSTEPLSEQTVCEKLIGMGELPATYLEDHAQQQGGPYAFIRGTLLALYNSGQLKMERNGEGRAVFALAA